MQSDFIQFSKKSWKKIIFITIIITIATTIFGYNYYKNKYSTTIFISIGVSQDLQNQNNQNNIFYNLQAADQFSETVQGWFKNPELLNRINNQSSEKTAFTVRKQEKQNLVITYSTDNEISGKKIAESIRTNLTQDIGKYNSVTNSKFQLTIFDHITEKQNFNAIIFGLFGIILGMILGVSFSRIYEYFN